MTPRQADIWQAYHQASEMLADAMERGLRQLGVNTYDTSSIRIEHRDNRMRYLWTKHGGFDLVVAAGVSIED